MQHYLLTVNSQKLTGYAACVLVIWDGQRHDHGAVGVQNLLADVVQEPLEEIRGGSGVVQKTRVVRAVKGEEHQHCRLLELDLIELVWEVCTQRHDLVQARVLLPAQTNRGMGRASQ